MTRLPTDNHLPPMAPRTVLRLGIGLIVGALVAVFLLLWTAVEAGVPLPGKNAVTPAKMQRGGLLFRTDEPGAFLPAPDLATEAHIRINGMVARVQVVQHFLNPHDEWQEGVYVFPLPDNAAYALPQTATPAQLKMLLGALALVLSGLTLWLYRRRA